MTQETVGAIDLGSKNMKVVIGSGRGSERSTRLLFKRSLQVGSDVEQNAGRISPQKMAEIVAAFQDAVCRFRAEGVDIIRTVATRAVLHAVNRGDLVEQLQELGIVLEVADGQREGVLSYLAATGGHCDATVTDFGSRSLEITTRRDGCYQVLQCDFGYVACYQRFIAQTFGFPSGFEALYTFMHDALDGMTASQDVISLAFGSMAAFVSGRPKQHMADRWLSRQLLVSKKEWLCALSGDAFDQLQRELKKCDKILTGLTLALVLCDRLDLSGIQLCSAELPVGLIVEALQSR